MQSFYDLTPDRLVQLIEPRRLASVHLNRVFGMVYRKGEPEPALAPGIPVALSQALRAFPARPLEVSQANESGYDHSIKFLFRLSDGQAIETVLMPEKRRLTVCLSSQVGCRQACTFCHTGRLGLKRHLSAGEIVAQVTSVLSWLRQNPSWFDRAGVAPSTRLSNVVFMGMGEPLDNVEAVADAVEILCHTAGLQLSIKRISVSTAGHLPGLKRLYERLPNVSLALSLHSPYNGERSQVMPINRKWPIADVLAFLRERQDLGAGDVFIQYTLLANVNDSSTHARDLSRLLSGLDVKINLIPFNSFAQSSYGSPVADRVEAFRDCLHEAGFRVMVRYSKGQDIAAACGQLANTQA